MVRLLVATCLLAFSSLTLAEQGDLAIQNRTVAYHNGNTKTNDIVPAIGIEYEVIDRIKVGYFYGRNSIPSGFAKHKHSNWLQAQYIFYRDKKFDMGVMASVANGYESKYFDDNIRESVSIQGCYKTNMNIHTCLHYTPWSDSPIPVQSLGFIVKFIIK